MTNLHQHCPYPGLMDMLMKGEPGRYRNVMLSSTYVQNIKVALKSMTVLRKELLVFGWRDFQCLVVDDTFVIIVTVVVNDTLEVVIVFCS